MRQDDIPIPSSISAEARAFHAEAAPVERWAMTPEIIGALRRAQREASEPGIAAACEACTERVEETEIAGVAVQTVVPKGYDEGNDGRALLYFFGGGHVMGSPSEDLPVTAPLAHSLGLKVHVPHYRLAPEDPFPAGLDDASAVYRALLDRLGPAGLALAGESAGGNLALAIVLRGRAEGLPLPAAAALLSPWSDLTKTGDSQASLAGLDPVLHYELNLEAAAAAYAGGRGLEDPLVSPVYADFRAGFPPTLITTGTRDLFLSDCARLSTAMRLAGVDARLHVWEGMWHVFEWYPQIPEGQRSLAEIADFLGRHLERG
jgi:acetyl esterase/lipase